MTEATPVAMEVWRKAKDACTTGWTATDDQAAAAVIATALADMQRRVEHLEMVLNYIAAEAASSVSSHDEIDVHAFERIEKNARQALSDKTQEKNDGISHD